jgi:gluconolactonase
MTELDEVEVVAEGFAFPEGPVAMADGSIIVVEVRGGRVSAVRPGGEVELVVDVGGGPNGAALGPDGALYICNNGGRGQREASTGCIQRIDLDSHQVDILYTECDGAPLDAPNDLVFDPTGHFWFTDFGGNAIYYASPDGGSLVRAVERAHAPNGIGLSPDGSVLYWAETYTRQLHRRRLMGPGRTVAAPPYEVASLVHGQQVEPWTLVVGLPGAQHFDSLAVDASGAVCIGTLIDSGVTVVNPEDGSTQKYTLPPKLHDGAVTNICFGGQDMQTAFLTCGVTGRLLSTRWPRPGLQLAYQQLANR